MGLNVGKMLACEPKIFWRRPLAGADFMLKIGVLRQLKMPKSDFATFRHDFERFLSIFELFYPISPWLILFSQRIWGRGPSGGRQSRLNVGTLLHVDRSPKCSINRWNSLWEP